MAQITDWIYDGITKAVDASNNWQLTKTAPAEVQLLMKFGSTQKIDNAAELWDNAIYDCGIPINWVSGEVTDYKGNTGSSTGVCTFDIQPDGANFKATKQDIYGQAQITWLIRMVWEACGVEVDGEHETYWMNKIIQELRQHDYKTLVNVVIDVSGGLLKGYVDRWFVQWIVDAMAEVGMLEWEKELYDIFPAHTTTELEFEDPEPMVQQVIDDAFNEVFYEWKERESSHVWDVLPSESRLWNVAKQALESEGVSLDDYKAVEMRSTYTTYSSNQLIIEFYFYNFEDDAFINNTNLDIERTEAPENFEGTQMNLGSNNSVIYENSFRVTQFMYYDTTVEGNIRYATPNIEQIPLGYVNNLDEWVQKSDSGQYVYTGGKHHNASAGMVTPVGITYEKGQRLMTTDNHTVSSFYPSWWGATKVVREIVLQESRWTTITFMQLGWNKGTVGAARTRNGEITNNDSLKDLGIYFRSMSGFTPMVIDPDDPEPDPIIVPDDDPKPEPTPEETTPGDDAHKLFQVHTLSSSEVDALGNFLYSSTFIAAIENMFTEPMDGIIALFTLHYHGGLPVGGSEQLKIGSVLGATGCTGTRITNRYTEFSCGTVRVNEHYKNVEDYAPFTTAQIWLPYIGFQDIDINDVMDASVTLKYIIDVYTGECVAKLFCARDGVSQELYTFSGSCAAHLPVTNRDFSNLVKKGATFAVGAGSAIATGGISAGSALAMGSSMLGSGQTIRRSGSIDGTSGAMGQQKPYILIRRPKAYNAANYPAYYGQPTHWQGNIGSFSGYTRVKYVHLDGIQCTDVERDEILTLLRGGVII